MKENEILELLLPEGLTEYFEITSIEKSETSYTLFLQEKNIPPDEYKDARLQSKGFYEPATVQDLPLRGKACFYRVKRRRWLNLENGHIVFRDWNVVAKGTRLTAEFATFLKELNRYHTCKH